MQIKREIVLCLKKNDNSLLKLITNNKIRIVL